MELRGVITSGRLVLDEGISLPDGTKVTVVVDEPKRSRIRKADALTKLASLAVRTGRRDLADSHDEVHRPASPRRRAVRKAKP